MENKVTKILIFLLLFILTFSLYSQERPKFTQKLEWTEDDAAYEYKVEIRSKGKSTFYETEENYLTLSLSAGDYEYRVYAYDFLGREASVSDWVNFSVIRAKTPVIKELKTNVVVSDSSYVTFDVPLDVSSITEETKVELINSKTKEKIEGHLELSVVEGEVVASKAVFPEVSEGDWYAKVTNPSGLFTETPSIAVEKSVEKAKEISEKDPEKIYIPSDADKLAEAARLAEEKRLADEAEAARLAEEKRLADEAEAARLAEEKRLADEAEAARLAEEKRLADEAEAVRLAEEKRLADEAEAARLAEEKRRFEELAKAESKETKSRYDKADTITEEIAELKKEIESTKTAAEIAKEKVAPEADILENRVDLLEERLKLAENAERLAAISAAYAEQSLNITNKLCNITEELSSVEALKNLKADADAASELAQTTFEEVEEQRKKLDKELENSQKSIDKKVKQLIRSQKPAKNINILAGGNVMYSPYDKQLFSYTDYPVYPAVKMQLGWSPVHAGKNLLGFYFDFGATEFLYSNENLSLYIPIMTGEFGLDYKQKLVEDRLYADFSLSGGVAALGRSVSYNGTNSRDNETMHFYVYPCVSASAGLYFLPVKHFAVEAGARFSHKFITEMPTGTAEVYLIIGLRL